MTSCERIGACKLGTSLFFFLRPQSKLNSISLSAENNLTEVDMTCGREGRLSVCLYFVSFD